MSHGLQSKISLWQKRADNHRDKQLVNPFSEWEGASHRARLDRTDELYGRPIEGSTTQIRGKKAGELISTEIIELCHVIQQLGSKDSAGNYTVKFGEIFEAYTRISNKLVGMLIRARKQSLVEFEGEMLFQGRDDDVLITLVNMPESR